MSQTDDLIPIGIDLGSLHARVAIGSLNHHNAPSEGLVDTRPLPNIISNAQGSRYTLALVGTDKSTAGMDDGAITNGVAVVEEEETRHVFGEAARRALARDKKPTISNDPSSMVRELVRSNSSVVGSTDEDESEEEKARAAAAFFGHLAELACDASSSHPSKLRTVVSVSVGSSPEEQVGIVQIVQRGISEAIAARMTSFKQEGFKKKKKDDKETGEDDAIVVGVITDPAAVCVAHGLTEIENPGVIDLASPKTESSSTWKNALVIDWGASGLTASHVRRTSTSSSLLTIVRYATDTTCSGTAIVSALVSHCASMFERKNRVAGVLDSVKAHHRLEMACESAVRTLSRAPTVTVAVDGLYEGMDMAVPISRPRFDMLVSEILRKAETLLQSFISLDRGCGCENDVTFDVVLLAGNVCDMPSATHLIRTKMFPNAHSGRADIPPDEAVAIGCARHAASVLSCPTHSKSIGPASRNVPKCPLTIGVCRIENGKLDGDMEEIISKTAVPLIEVGEPLPANITRKVTYSNGDESWLSNSSIAIVQIQGGATAKSKVLGKIDKIPYDSKSIEMTIELSSAGRLTVSVDGGPSCTL